jgi:hypothetical protein
MVIFVFGIPLFLSFKLKIAQEELAGIEERREDDGDLERDDQALLTEIRVKYGFLYTGYSGDCFAWDAVIIWRKCILSGIVMFMMQTSSEAQI